MNKRAETYALVAGLIFVISGITKSLDIAAFANTIALYGFGNLQFLSPCIVMIEVATGLMLVFQIWTKRTAFACGLLLAAFTLVYAYGLIFKDIEDCGCFGKITFLNTSPVFTFLRNAVLLYLLVAVWRKADNLAQTSKSVIAVIVAVMCTAAFMSGYNFRFAGKKEAGKETIAIESSALKDFLKTSKDSTYLVFAFTYACPHCMNSIENLKQYEASGAVDKVVGLAVADSLAEQNFRQIFSPNFEIKNLSPQTLFQLTNTFPTIFYIRNDSIIVRFSGELPCSYVFSKTVLE